MQELREDERYLSYQRATDYTGLSHWTLRRAVRAGRLEAVGKGRNTRFDRYELDRWIQDGAATS